MEFENITFSHFYLFHSNHKNITHIARKSLENQRASNAGAVLLNSEGERFANELGTRDYIAKRMSEEARDAGLEDLHFHLMLNADSAAEADKHVPLYVANYSEKVPKGSNSSNMDTVCTVSKFFVPSIPPTFQIDSPPPG